MGGNSSEAVYGSRQRKILPLQDPHPMTVVSVVSEVYTGLGSTQARYIVLRRATD
jgi:hypothetical protein